MKKIIFVVILGILMLGGAAFYLDQRNEDPETKNNNVAEESEDKIGEPLSNSGGRITKKPFGIFVTPNESPVEGEKFTGFHTGTDFEVNKDEVNKTIAVSAVCSGQIIKKENIAGYGGVLVQNCNLDGKGVNVIYGHLNIDDTSAKQAGSVIKKGEFLANLGADKSIQTDKERKHLHLGIFRGGEVDYRGYVQEKSELSGWLNFEDFLK